MPSFSPNRKILSGLEALLITVGIILPLVALGVVVPRLIILGALAIFGTSVWAALDSARVQLQAYKTRFSLHPLILFNVMYFLWPVVFPWYLVVRSRILEAGRNSESSATRGSWVAWTGERKPS